LLDQCRTLLHAVPTDDVARGLETTETPNLPATLMVATGFGGLVNQTVRLVGRVGGALPGRKMLTLVAAILAGGSHIDHANKLRAGATGEVLPFQVMAPSTRLWHHHSS
jgi:hypothetical protein